MHSKRDSSKIKADTRKLIHVLNYKAVIGMPISVLVLVMFDESKSCDTMGTKVATSQCSTTEIVEVAQTNTWKGHLLLFVTTCAHCCR